MYIHAKKPNLDAAQKDFKKVSIKGMDQPNETSLNTSKKSQKKVLKRGQSGLISDVVLQKKLQEWLVNEKSSSKSIKHVGLKVKVAMLRKQNGR